MLLGPCPGRLACFLLTGRQCRLRLWVGFPGDSPTAHGGQDTTRAESVTDSCPDSALLTSITVAVLQEGSSHRAWPEAELPLRLTQLGVLWDLKWRLQRV